MPKYKPLYSLYKGLRESKYDVPDSYVSFQKTLTQAGDAGAKSRRGLYQSLKDSNYDVPDTYEDFYKNLFVPVNSTTSRALKIGENPNTPTVNRYRQKMFDSVDPNKNGLNNLSNRAVGQAVRATNNVRKPVIAKVVNQKGKPTGKEFAITPAKTAEDLDREYAQETTKNWENELHDQIADADKDAAKISDMFKSFIGSTDEVGSVWGNMTRGGGIAGTPHSVTTNNGILENTEARQILAAGDYNRKRRELLQLEQDSRNGAIFDNHSFFRGMYGAAKDTGFLTGGASDLINAGSLLATKQDLDNGVHTEAGDMLMQQAVRNSNAQSQYGDNQGWMYTGGVITTNMAPFMVQIGSAGFSKGMSNTIGKVVQGAASKVALGTMEKATGMAGAHIANYIGKVTGLTTKAFGKAIQYGIVGAAQANTVGLGNVANDVINRYTGQVYQDEQGNYKFGTFDSDGKLVHEGGEDFLTSLVKGDAAQTIEFATELAGGGIDAVGTALKNFVTKGGKKIINKYNMENVSKVIDFLLNNKVSKNARYLKAGADRTLGKVELNSIVGESLEEELGIIANTVFTGDNKISDLWNEKQQSQIWGGMLLSIGLMKGAVAPFYAYNAKQYYSYKHKLDKADVNLSQLLGKEKWEELRNQIDATTNDDMPEMVNKINRDVALGKNRQPVREYIQNLLIMRGYDIGNMLAAKKAVEDKGEGVSVKNMEKNQAYQQGRGAYGYDTHEIQLDQEEKQKSLAQLLGISEQQLASMSDEELEALSGRDDNIDRAIYDYQLSTGRYEGVIDNARDQIDLEVQRAAQAVDMYTDKSRNTIRNATIKATGGLEDYGVYIINGNIATHEDGSIDISNSDDMILYYDPTTNTVEHADAMMFAELGSEENADEVRSQAMADAKEKAIKETTGIIDGVVEVGTQFKTVDTDGTEHTYEVLADNGDGTAVITIDGNVPTELVKGENVQVPVSFEELQKMKDESDQQRLQAAKAQREQMEKERAEQQMQAQTTQAENPSQEDNIQPAPIEDNLDYSDIIRDDGKVQVVDVSDKDGNNLFPDAKDVFYIQGNKMRTKFAYIDANGELKTQSFPTGLVKIKTRGEVSVDDYKKYRNMILSAESSAMPETSMIEDNRGSIEADRGGIEVEDNTQPLSEADADNVIAQMESSAEAAPDLELTPDNWTAEFGEDGILSTPVGDVKMGENHVAKLFEKGRSKEFGMIKPTLTNPDVIIEVPSHSADGNEERSSSYLFIKTFLGKNGKKVYYFKSVTIRKDGLEISISSHYDRAKRVKETLMKGKLLYRKNDGAQTEQNQPSTSVTTSQEDAAGSSESKDTNISSNGNENNESLTFEDGTPIPVDMNGETDLSQTDAAHAAEWYDNNLGEDADDWLDGEIKKAKKVLEQAKNKKLAGTKPSELVASKKEKEAAIADAQAHYDSAISIRDSLKERRIAKEENTSEGRKELIEKARRKFARLKSAVKDDAEAVSQLYRDTIGSLLHRLYDGTGIDVTDTIPLTAEEYVASNLGAHSLNYEGTETSKGVKQETGLSREDFAKTQLLAADGKGTTIDALVHSLWENRPSNLESLDTQDIRNALIGVLNSGFKASEARNFVENIRIAQAENILEEQKRAQENAAYAEQHKAEQEAELKAKSDEKAELKAKSEEKLDNESDNKSNDLSNESDNEKINDNINDNINTPEQNKFPDNLKEWSKTIEVPEDATEEKPLGEQISKDKVPFEIKGEKSGETYDINDKEDRKRLVAENSVDDKDILDIDMPKHVHKAIKELCKKMGLKVQFLYMGAELNGWIENGTMYLALDANKAIQFVFGHEMTHAIKQKNPEAYKELIKVAMAVTTRKEFEEDLAKVYRIYHNASGYNNIDDFVEEVIADNIGKFINDHDLAQRFVLRLNHPVLATILHAIQKIKGLLYGDPYKSVDALERIVEKAYVDTANGEVTNSETGEDVSFSLRQKPEPKKKGVGYKVFVLKDGKLYPPMVANPDGAATPVGVWLDADAAPIAGESKTGRPQVKQGGKGTQGGSGKLAYRPGWHLGVVPYAIQFNRKDAEGNKTLFPKNFVFAEVEYAADVDYQEEARQEGINSSGKYQHSLAGLKHLPTNGYYMYRTNPNPETDPWVITGAMKVNRILTRAEQAELVKNAGREPQQIQEGDIVTDDVVNSINQEIADAPKFSLKVYHGSGAMQITEHTKFSLRLKSAIEETETNPSYAQKESGNYKKGHIKFGGYDYTIENPKGSTRSGKDADGKEWKVTMHDTYGYIRGKFGKDGDHLDMFINDKADLDNWNGDVFVVDQVNPDGSFDEHKVMYGYDSMDDAKKAYLANYSDGWQGLGNITGASKDEFDKWLDTSNRKLKPFADYAKVKFSLKDEEYLKAVEDGNMEKAQKMVNEAADAAGYSTDSSYQGTSAFNGAAPWGNGYFLTKDERKEAWDNGEFEGESTLGDYINDDIDGGNLEELTNAASYRAADPMRKDAIDNVRNAIHKKANTITMYRSVPSDVKEGSFRNGDWVTPSRAYAVDNAKLHGWGDDYNIIEQKVPVDDVWFDGNDIAEWGYGREEDYINDTDFAYKNSKNNKKLLDAVTYDDNGNVIPLSQRFNEKNKDVRFSLKDEKTLAGVHNISEEKLLKAIKQGGLANPSVAVIDSSRQDHKAYGGISLILPSDKIAKRTGKNAGTWQGDAYTPTYPQVERHISDKGSEQVNKDVLSVPKEMQHEVRNGIYRWLDGDANSGLKYLFLHEKGVAPEPKKIQPKFSDEAYNELKFITAGDFNIYGIGKADAQKVLDMYIEAKFDGDKDLYEEKTKAWLERNKSIVDAGAKGGMRYAIAKENVELYDEYGFNYKGVQTFVRDVEYDHRKSGVDTNATLNEVEDYIKTNNLTDEFNTWLEGKEKEYGIKEVIFDGFTPSGNRRYVPNTLENVSKLMKKQGRNGATGAAVSFQNFAARLMPSYGTLKDIRSKKGLLTSDREKFDKFREKWSNVFFELGMKCQPDATGTFDDYGLARLSEAAMTSDPQAYLKKEYNVDFSDEDTKRLKEMVKAIKEEHPAMYFETKFERPVRFDEFSAAVVPTTTKKEVKEALKNAGVSIFEYDEKNDADRSRAFNEAINSSDNIRFSLRGSTPYDKQMEEWMEKNHLEKGAVPMEKPIMKEGENIFDYANRMVEWTRNQNLWKTAPKQTGFQDALDKWKADNGLSPDAYPPVRPHRENYSTEIGYAEDLEEYNKKKELWKSAPKPKDFDLSVDLEDMNKQLRNIRRAVLNQKNYDQRAVKAVSDLVRKMLNIGWGDGLSRGKVGNLLSAAKNATGANDVKKYLDKAMGILAENYLNRLSTAYDNLINTKGARADQSGVIKIGSLDAKGQAFMSEYKKAINMDDSSLNTYIANIEEDSAKNEDNVEMNDYRLAGIQAAIMYKQQIGGNDADISELKRQIGELKNKKDATKEDKDLLKSLEKKLFENKFDRITMYENLLNNIQRMVKESKGRAKEFREEIAEHKNEILHRANLDLEGVDSTYYDTTTAKKKFVNNDLQRAVFSSTYTFEQFLKFFGKHSANGEGRLYNYFHKLNQDALDEEQLYNEMNRNALDEKTKELFGKNKFMNLVGVDGKGMKEMDVEVTDYSNKETGKRTIHLKQGQMLYIYLVNKETDGEMKLRAMGITEEDVAAIEENLDPRVKAMGEWLQDEYLPECQRRYQATHTKYFGAPMKEVENYFPLAINNRARNVKEDVNQDSDAMSQLAGTSTGAIVTRRVNVIPLDIENADAFEVAFNHLQEMEEWSAMLPFRQDINTLLSYTHFRNQVQNMSSVAYGSGKTLWDEFKQTAQIAAGTYKPKVNAGMMDSRIAAAMGGVAVAKISGRLWTAIKQSQSATVFLPECDFTRFVKNGVNPYGSWKWAMENIPDFRKRVENMTYGDVKLRQYLDELEKWHDWTKTISKIGMAPNILVDGITCAVGARSVYETEVNRLTKLGYPMEKAEEKAYYKAVAAYNKTQQSSGGMYLSPMQVDRTYVSAALSLFKNANYAYGRMQIEACRGLARTYDLWGGKHKTTLIESMTRQIMEEDGLDENTARAIAKATYNRTFRQSIGRLINFATLVPVSWALYKVLPYLLTGDDDDKKKDMIEEAVLKGFATSLSDNYVIPFASNILNAGLKVEDGKPTFDPEVFRYQNLYINPATSDLSNIYSMVGNQKWYSVANKLGMLGVQSLIGFNPETVGALYQALSEADYDNGNTAKEWQIGILKAISAPEESIRELYMDELGLKSGDIKKIPLAELEKRYAERQINRDNLLSQIGMDAETFNGYVDKYQKSFEKKIKDKMDKWDEYDKKKADEFFDTTSDPKLKDMIEKKRTKDANAAADEQIAKEGLNQENKGKEPSEEAYDAVKMSIDVAEDNAISTYNKVLNKRYAALNDEYNEQTDAMKYIFMSKHPNFKAYKELESEYTKYGKKIKELKGKMVSADGYDVKQAILKQIRAEREKFSELQSKVR